MALPHFVPAKSTISIVTSNIAQQPSLASIRAKSFENEHTHDDRGMGRSGGGNVDRLSHRHRNIKEHVIESLGPPLRSPLPDLHVLPPVFTRDDDETLLRVVDEFTQEATRRASRSRVGSGGWVALRSGGAQRRFSPSMRVHWGCVAQTLNACADARPPPPPNRGGFTPPATPPPPPAANIFTGQFCRTRYEQLCTTARATSATAVAEAVPEKGPTATAATATAAVARMTAAAPGGGGDDDEVLVNVVWECSTEKPSSGMPKNGNKVLSWGG